MRASTPENTLTTLKEEFINDCEARSLSKYTIKNYNRIIGIFLDVIKIKNPKELNKSHINKLITHIKDTKTNNDISVNTYVRTVRTFAYWCMENYDIQRFKIRLGTAQKVPKATYTLEELEALLSKPDTKKCRFSEYRNWVVINWLLSTGCRLSSMIGVKCGDINTDDGSVIFRHTKNKAPSFIYINKEMCKILKDYLNYRKAKTPEDHLFCTEFGHQMTMNGMVSAIRRYNLRLGINKTSIHLFRHTFAKNWIMNGGDIFRLQKIQMHKSSDTLKHYVEIYGEDLKNIDDFVLLNKFKTNKKIKMG